MDLHPAELFHHQDAACCYQFEKPDSSGEGDDEQVGDISHYWPVVVSFLVVLKHLGAGRTSFCSSDA